MNYDDFLLLHGLLNAQPRFEAWKDLQQKILEAQLQIDLEKVRSGDIDEYISLRILQRLIDSMFWMQVRFELTDVRRIYYSGVKIMDLRESNLSLHVRAIQDWHDTTEDFALHADLATHIAVGDVVYLMKDDHLFMPSELKEGSVNEQIVQALELKEKGDDSLYNQLASEKKKRKQLERVKRQKDRIEEQTTLYLENEVYVKPTAQFPKGGNIYITPQPENLPLFDAILKNLLNAPCPEGWLKDKVDNCLDIVVIRSEEGLKKFSEAENGNKTQKIVTSLKEFNLEETFSRPLFTINIEPQQMWEILTGQTIVLMMFSMEDYLEKFSNGPAIYKKVTGKKYRQLAQLPPGQRPAIFPGDYAIATVSDVAQECYWTDAMFYRIFGCLQTPGAIHSIQSMALPSIKKMSQIETKECSKKWRAKS